MERRIAFLGPRGTNSEEAARFLFTEEEDVFCPYSTIPDCLDAVAEEKIDFAVVPLENSIEGSVTLTLDWLIHKVSLPFLAELAIPISQHLVVAAKDSLPSLSEIKKVLSHPMAIAQCREFLRKNLPDAEIEYVSSTAEAPRLVGENPEEPWAAVCSLTATKIYPVKILRGGIEDRKNNYTRFVVVGKKELKSPDTERRKTTILVTLPSDFPGALYQVLAAFAWRKINLSRIESRPTKTGLGNYHFVIDIEQGMDEVLLPGAFAEIEALGCQIRLMGTYPVYVKKTVESPSASK